MNISQIMTKEVVSLPPNATVLEAANVMDTRDIRHVLIAKDNELQGIVSDRDIRRHELPFDQANNDYDAALDRYDMAVSKIMQRDVETLTPQDAVSEAIEMLVNGKFGVIPIVEPEGATIAGVLSYIDVLLAMKNCCD